MQAVSEELECIFRLWPMQCWPWWLYVAIVLLLGCCCYVWICLLCHKRQEKKEELDPWEGWDQFRAEAGGEGDSQANSGSGDEAAGAVGAVGAPGKEEDNEDELRARQALLDGQNKYGDEDTEDWDADEDVASVSRAGLLNTGASGVVTSAAPAATEEKEESQAEDARVLLGQEQAKYRDEDSEDWDHNGEALALALREAKAKQESSLSISFGSNGGSVESVSFSVEEETPR